VQFSNFHINSTIFMFEWNAHVLLKEKFVLYAVCPVLLYLFEALGCVKLELQQTVHPFPDLIRPIRPILEFLFLQLRKPTVHPVPNLIRPVVEFLFLRLWTFGPSSWKKLMFLLSALRQERTVLLIFRVQSPLLVADAHGLL